MDVFPKTENDTKDKSNSLEAQDKLAVFRNLINGEVNLRCPMDDIFLLRFLNTTDLQVHAAFQILKKYYEMRRKNASIFQDLYPKVLLPVLQEKLQIALPLRDDKRRQLFLFRAGDWNPSTVDLDDVFRSNYLFLEEMTSAPDTQINGIVSIVDFAGFGFHQAREFILNSRHTQRMVQILQGAFPVRFKEFHLINQPFFFNMIFTVLRPLLSEKIKNRIFFHGHNLESLHKSVSPSILPNNLGGEIELDIIKNDDFIQKLVGKDLHYKAMLGYGYTHVGKSVQRK